MQIQTPKNPQLKCWNQCEHNFKFQSSSNQSQYSFALSTPEDKLNFKVNYLLGLKLRIVNKEIQVSAQDVKEVIRIFNKQQQSVQPSIKILIACLNMLCVVVHKQPRTKELLKPFLSLKFIGNFLRIKIDDIMAISPNIQSSLCFILQIMTQIGFAKRRSSIKMKLLFKQFCLQLLTKISNNPKVVYNTLKIVEWLQIHKIICSLDFHHYHINKLIKIKSIAFQAQNLVFYQLSYRLLISAGYLQQAFSLYKHMVQKSKNNGIQAFLTTIGKINKNLPPNILNSILGDHIFSDNLQLTLPFFQMIHNQIMVFDTLDFINLVEQGFVEALLCKCEQVVSNNQINKFLELIKLIQKKAMNTVIRDALNDTFKVFIPQLNNTLNQIRAERAQDQ